MQTGDTTNSTIKIKGKVQKLLNQAADRQGTAEGEIYYRKAFELMASHGFDERDLAAPDEGDDVVHKVFEFAGAYTEMQSTLLLAMSSSLHCTGFAQRVHRSTRISSATVFGLRRHLDRVEMLFTLLNPVMIAQARGVSAEAWEDVSTVVKRRSFMSGFARQIGARLSEAEHRVADDRDEYALVLVDDVEKAQQAQEEYAAMRGLLFSHYHSQRSFDGVAYGQGVEAGSRSDLGQTRVWARRALPF
ncbi:DUF2786 domain-containing protein [Corynebacterium qintianiae]|uniref:DUF2786 domain-containing protein n=1 Tax=Corynebacterium qintianiae TaxID=2709392 RepID=A0A7T0KNP2_9CORY|nr:DUF2786 domain-containing protein [Corynebacterium qintianiae]QPK83545.1 DUF2786 domain-containing protein [Corynebacterium qintianiae]